MRPGWFIAFFAAILSISAWLPWLTTAADGGGHASAIGGSVGSLQLPARFGVGQAIVLLAAVLLVVGAMVGRRLSLKVSSVVALAVSLLIAALIVWYYHMNVVPPAAAGYGLYLAAASATGAVGCSVWALTALTLQHYDDGKPGPFTGK
ncbi:MAG TPA: hypothetical protein VF299_09000 [Mycobacterium sp.]